MPQPTQPDKGVQLQPILQVIVPGLFSGYWVSTTKDQYRPLYHHPTYSKGVVYWDHTGEWHKADANDGDVMNDTVLVVLGDFFNGYDIFSFGVHT